MVSRTEMSSLMRVFPTFLYHLCSDFLAFFLSFALLKILRRAQSSPYATFIFGSISKSRRISCLWKSVQLSGLFISGYLTWVSRSALVSPLLNLGASNFSFLRLGGRPKRLPFLLFFAGCFSLYLFLFLAFCSCRFLNSRSCLLTYVVLARLSFMRIASSPFLP